ncbi:MAG: CPBP family intramembrane glutamic endopeptidase [Gemmataceae bacterium]
MKKGDLAALAFAILFPTVSAWAYFMAFAKESPAPAATESNPRVQAAYGLGKAVQFGFPLLWVWGIERRRVWPGKPSGRGLALGIGFGLAVSFAGLALYAFVFRDRPLFRGASEAITEKTASFGADTPARFLAFTAFLVVIHSLLEEYYWRWFVYGKLRDHMPTWGANLLSSVAFMAYHVVLLFPFFSGKFLMVVMPLSLCIAIGGAVWAWLYERTGSIYAPWLSHLIIDTAIFAVGFDLIFVKKI